MKPLSLLLVLLAASPAFAQTIQPPGCGDGVGADGRPAECLTPEEHVAIRFQADLADLARLASTAALVHERTGQFPDTPFGLLGAPEAGQTQARTFRLSDLSVAASGDSLVLAYVPLPTSPYVREDLVVTATMRPDGPGRYLVTHDMRRRTDPDDGGRMRPYGDAGRYRVSRGFGRLCIETAQVRARIADGSFEPSPFNGDPYAVSRRYLPETFSSEPMTLRIHTPDTDEPALYETARTTAQ